MVSHGSHTNHEFLMLAIWVPNVSFAVESFATCEKVLIMMLRNLPNFKILVSFLFFSMADLLQIKLWEILQKIGRKKTSVKDETPVKLQVWHFTYKTSL